MLAHCAIARDSEHKSHLVFLMEKPLFISPQTRLKMDSRLRGNDDFFEGW
jgi:hypothetical protein